VTNRGVAALGAHIRAESLPALAAHPARTSVTNRGVAALAAHIRDESLPALAAPSRAHP
jgi:hypothetical protein